AHAYEGKRLNYPNDAAVKSDGSVWFTDPPYGINAATQKEQPKNFVFRFDPRTGALKAVVDDFDMPNGLCFSPDETKLYIADSGKPRHIRVFDVQPDATLAGGTVFCEIDNGLPDGIRADTQGRLYSTAADGVQIFSPEGRLIAKILVPEAAANCCFGGPGGHTLFVTAQTSVYAIHLMSTGAPQSSL
ncbi:MAG: SMP-30/gluconolactonase/LRE family protein, partial [Chloroflexi bacterium]|nr:SMP-30/gluconolactonase/LRE family protein [Chloroflexota bacterium]